MSKTNIADQLRFAAERIEFAMERTSDMNNYQAFLLSKEGMDKFDATCMRLQTIGETMKKIDGMTEGQLLTHYPEIPWKNIFGLRNVISHDYHSVDPEVVFDIVKAALSPLHDTIEHIITDIEAGKYDILF